MVRRKKTTLQTLAYQLGVSKVTVYKALNNQPGVSRDLHKKIHDLAASTGYLHQYNKNNLQNASFAFVTAKRFFSEQEMFYTNIYFHLNNLLAQDERNLSLFVIEEEKEMEGTLPANLNANLFNGIIVGGEMSHDFLKRLSQLKLPIVIIDYFTDEIVCDCILIDNYKSGTVLTEYLIKKGHREIGFVGEAAATHNGADRYFGYRKALLFANLDYCPEWNIVNNDATTNMYYLDFQIPKKLPTAFVCHCDKAAYFMVQRLNMMGLTVPNDISLAAFDNTDLALRVDPPLTTVENNRELFASKAYATMLRRLTKNPSYPMRIQLETQIIERKSVVSLI